MVEAHRAQAYILKHWCDKNYLLRPSIDLIRSRMISVIGVVDILVFLTTALTLAGFRAFTTFFTAGLRDLTAAFFLIAPFLPATAFFLATFGLAVTLRVVTDFFFTFAFFKDFAFGIVNSPLCIIYNVIKRRNAPGAVFLFETGYNTGLIEAIFPLPS
jgi:hypothetical protein